jgi:hypothetical protein
MARTLNGNMNKLFFVGKPSGRPQGIRVRINVIFKIHAKEITFPLHNPGSVFELAISQVSGLFYTVLNLEDQTI